VPGIFDPSRVAANEQRDDVLGQVGGNGEFASIQRRVADARQPVFGLYLERDEVAPRRTDNHFRVSDFHWVKRKLQRRT
jgi:hypothetical protein